MRESPLTLQRDDLVFHKVGRVGSRSIYGGCGYMLKPTSQGAYQQRVMPTLVMVAILRGQGVFTDWHDIARPVSAGQMIVLPPGLRHGVVQQADGRWVEFYFTAPATLYHTLRQLGTLPSPSQSHVFDVEFGPTQLGWINALHQCGKQVSQHDLPLFWSHCQYLLAQLLHRQDSRSLQAGESDQRSLPADIDQLMHRAAQMLRAQPQRRLSLADIASQLNMGYETFRKQFRQVMGVSPGDYRIARRMELAQQLINDHHLSAKEVAYRLGYTDPFTFSKQFRKMVGVSPREFRMRR